MKITFDQLRAARSLLNLDQKDVAAATGINVNVISRVERGASEPRDGTVAPLIQFYEQAGIEFLESNGIRQRKAMVQTYEDQRGFRMLMDQVFETARDHGGRISLFNGPPRLFLEWLGEDWYVMHAKRMHALRDRIDFRIIVKEGETQLIASGFAQYRCFPEDKFKNRTIYAFGDKVAFLNFEDDLRIVVISQRETVESFHILFDLAWENMATEPVA